MSLLALSGTLVAAQQATGSHVSEAAFGYVYRLPEDWAVIETKAPALEQQQKEADKTSVVDQKKGIQCLEVPVTARHGDPPTTIVIDALPYDCYGQKMTKDDLQAFGSGAAEGLRDTFEIATPVEANYTIADHPMWIERARATPKGKTGPMYTLEVVCTVLSRAAVCWVARAADEAGLKTFEQIPVTLDGISAKALVPNNVFIISR